MLGLLMFVPAFRTAFTMQLSALPEEQRKFSSWVNFLYESTGTFQFLANSNIFLWVKLDTKEFLSMLCYGLEHLKAHVQSEQWSILTNLSIGQTQRIITSIDTVLSFIDPSSLGDGTVPSSFNNLINDLVLCDLGLVPSTGVVSQSIVPSSVCPSMNLFSFHFNGGILQQVTHEVTDHFYVVLFSILFLVSGSYHEEPSSSYPIVTTNKTVAITAGTSSLIEYLVC